MAKPVQVDMVDTPSGSETASTKTDVSPPNEKRPKINGKQTGSESGQSSEKENQGHDGRQISRGSSLQGKGELKRQFSLDTHANLQKGSKERLNAGESGDIDKLRDRSQIQNSERGRNRERSPVPRRHHSQPRLSETDTRFNAQEHQHTERDRYARGEPPRSRDPSRDRGGETVDKGKYSEDGKRHRQNRDGHDSHMERKGDVHASRERPR